VVACAEADPDAAGELDWPADPDGELDPDGEVDEEGDWLGSPPVLPLDPEELVDGEGDGDGDEGEGDGDGDDDEGEGDGDGLGEGEDAAGSVWHVVAVSGAVVALMAVTVSAWAVPGRTASPPTSTKPPASKLAAALRTCLKRMVIACLRCSSGY
jgi:hypothetical protein